MTKRNPPARWVLPNVVDPPTRTCYTIPVPDDPYHRAAFRGALLDLASAYKWADDPSHTAKDVANVWKDIYDLVVECENSTDTTIESWDEDLTSLCEALRFQNGKLQALCCGTWTDITGQPSQGWGIGAIGSGIAEPAAGGCQSYSAALSAQGLWLLPFPVSTGDTIQVSNMKGASYNPVNSSWYCPDGQQFIAGACTPFPITNASNPMPAVASGRLIAKIGATFYDVQAGAPFTVPGGITGQNVVFQLNYQTIASSSGNLTFDVIACNNTAVNWTHVYDFRTSPYSSIFSINTGGDAPISTAGVYVAGVGYQTALIKYAAGSRWYRIIDLQITKTFMLTSWTVEFTYVAGAYGGNTVDSTWTLQKNGPVNLNVVTMPTAPVSPKVYTNAGLAITSLRTNSASGYGTGVDGGGQVTITKITVQGTGPDPF